MDLLQIVRNIQYQIAKIEVIELLYWHKKNNNPGLDAEISYNLFTTVRQNLLDTSEACLTANTKNLVSCINSLQNSLVTTNRCLLQTNSNFTDSDLYSVFLKDLLNQITEELVSLNTALSELDLQPVEEKITEISSYIDDSSYIDEPEITAFELDETVEDIDTSIDEVLEDESIDSATEETPKKLDLIPLEVNQIVETNDPAINEVVESESINSITSETPKNRDFEILTQLCDEDSEQAESWIEFEQQRNGELTREDAIASAIQINSNLQDKFNLLLLIQKIICESLEVEANDIEINNDTNLSEFYNPYIDSTDMLEKLMNLEEILDIDIPDEVSWGDALPRNTIGCFIDFIIKELEKKQDLEIEAAKLKSVKQSKSYPLSSYNEPVATNPETQPKETKPIPDEIKFESRFELLVYQCNNSQVDAEFWIESEQKHNANLSRDKAIESAIEITSHFSDKAHIFTLVQEFISEYLEIEVGEISLDEPIGGKTAIGDIEKIEFTMALEEFFDIDISDDKVDSFLVFGYGQCTQISSDWITALLSYDPKDRDPSYILCTGRALLDFMYKQLKELSAEAN